MLEYVIMFCVIMCLLYLIEISADLRELKQKEKKTVKICDKIINQKEKNND